MSVSEPLAVARATEHATSAQFKISAHAAQSLSAPVPPVESSELVQWAHHDTVRGHAVNALVLLQLLEPLSFADPEVAGTLLDVTRRLQAIVELAR